MVSLYLSCHKKVSLPQGKPNGVQVEDCGESKSRSVMGQREVETSLHTKVGRLPQGGYIIARRL